MSIDSRFEQFMLSLPSVEGIDFIELEQHLRREKKADYLGMGRKVIFEQKCVNQEQSDKIKKELNKYLNDENYPVFYGERDFSLVIKNLPNRDEIKRKVFTQITKLLESYLRQTNKQIESTRKVFGIDNAMGVLIILNEKVKILSPKIVVTRLQQRLNEKKGTGLRFNNIDYIIFVSETHLIRGVPSVVILEGMKANSYPEETSSYINYIVNGWAQFNGVNLLEIKDF